MESYDLCVDQYLGKNEDRIYWLRLFYWSLIVTSVPSCFCGNTTKLLAKVLQKAHQNGEKKQQQVVESKLWSCNDDFVLAPLNTLNQGEFTLREVIKIWQSIDNWPKIDNI